MLRSQIEELQSLAFLKKLTISSNELTELWPVPLQLESLIVSHNKLTSLGDNIPKLVNLKLLDVSFNYIANCNGVQNLTKLQTLNASNNEVYFY